MKKKTLKKEKKVAKESTVEDIEWEQNLNSFLSTKSSMSNLINLIPTNRWSQFKERVRDFRKEIEDERKKKKNPEKEKKPKM